MKKTYWFIICAVLITALVGVASAETFDLIAGGGNVNGATDVGDVTLTVTGNELTVYYDLDEGWWLTETHVAVAKTQNQIPQKNGNPIPGKFSDTATHTYATEYTETVNLAGLQRPFVVAIHGVVVDADGVEGVTGLCAILPDEVIVTYEEASQTDLVSFFKITILDTWLAGIYDAWCIDSDNSARPIVGNALPAKVFCSYEPIPVDLVEHPENLDLVNWIVNQEFLGNLGPTSVAYTTGDIQIAIWSLLEDRWVPVDGPWTQANVDEILRLAALHEGFVPGCGEDTVVIIAPLDEMGAIVSQIMIIQVPVPCGEGDETIWGAQTLSTGGTVTGYDWPFSGRNWATFVKLL
jgi:hypothetical protein